MLQNLPLGRSTFSALRAGDSIYVDKTSLVYELAKNDSKVLLIRPRRFGKSLLASTFESLFKYGLRDFKDLAIEKLWDDKTYKVVRLDFSEVKEFMSAEDFKERFATLIASKFKAVGFSCTSGSETLFAEFSVWLDSLEPRSLVIVIDEYDAPLTQCLTDMMLFNRVRSVMSQFFLILKANDGCQRFFFMTGITKFSHTSIFSAFNNLQDISLDPLYGSLLGYTEEELHRYFLPHIQKAAECLGISQDQVFEELRLYYDGFCFDEKAQHHVYCPWSVLNFLNRPDRGFQNYWYASGGQPAVLMNYLLHHPLSQPIAYAENHEIRLSELGLAQQYDDVGLDVLLTQAGYYTIRSVTDDGYAVLGYPNREVAVSMAQLYSNELLKGQRLLPAGPHSINKVMSEGSLEEVVAELNAVLRAIDYQRYPIKDEAGCQAYLQVLLIGAAMLPRVEVHNALGRSDMEVLSGKRHWIFEFKYSRTQDQVQPLLAKALRQIQNRQYGEMRGASELIRVALVFSQEKRQFVAWQKA